MTAVCNNGGADVEDQELSKETLRERVPCNNRLVGEMFHLVGRSPEKCRGRKPKGKKRVYDQILHGPQPLAM